MENLKQIRCVQHDQDFLAVQISQENKDENKYYCPQCLIELITNKQLILISQAKQQIENKKKQMSKKMQEECQEKINIMSNLKNNIEKLQGPLKLVLNSFIGEIEQFKSETYNLLQQSQKISQETQGLDQDLNLLSDEKSAISTLEEKDDLMKKQVLNQIKYSHFSKVLNELLSEFKKMATLPNDCSDSSLEEKNPKLKKKLSQNCKIHNDKLKMLKLDENNRVEKFACLQCIQESKGNFKTPTQFLKSFEDYEQQSEKALKYFQQLQKQTTNKSINLLHKIRDMYIQQINLQVKQLQENENSFKTIIDTSLQFKDQNILLIEQDQQLKILQPVYSKESPDHFYNIIERQLVQDKNLQKKFEEIMQELIKFEIQNQNKIYIEQLEHEVLLKKLVNKILEQPANQENNDINLNSKDEEGIYNLENQINSFLSKKMTIYMQYGQLLQKFENSKELQIEQDQLIQKLNNEQNQLNNEQNKLNAQQINSVEQKQIAQTILEKKKIHLERLMTNINSNSFQNQISNEIPIQIIQSAERVQKQLNQSKDKIIRFEVETIKKNISYQPYYDNSCKSSFLSYQSWNLIRVSSGGWGLAVMQPPLPNDKVSKFIFKINKFHTYAGVGICHLQTAKGYSYNMNSYYQSQNHNAYLVCAGGNLISSKLGYTTTNFTFGDNGIIICEYDPKNLRLNLQHLNDGNTYQVDLVKNDLEMSPCIIFNGAGEIEIL